MKTKLLILFISVSSPTLHAQKNSLGANVMFHGANVILRGGNVILHKDKNAALLKSEEHTDVEFTVLRNIR